ncbi:MAG: SH3 domain-containing protein [Verrucomicrobiota bacterium]
MKILKAMAVGRVTPPDIRCRGSCAPLAAEVRVPGAHRVTRPTHRRAVAAHATLLLLVLLMTLATGDGFAVVSTPGEATAQFEAANKLYEQGKFAEAAAAYETIQQSGVASPALYFNLGNALFKSARIGRALVAYRQAEQLAPRDPDVRANLQFARNQVQGPTRHAGRVERWLATLSLNEWTALAAGALWLTFISLAAIQLQPKLAQSLRTLTGAAAIATVIFGACLGLALATQNGAKSAVITAREVTVHNGPFDESPNAFTAHDGAELRVLDRKDDWLQVTDDNRRTGWLKRGEVTLLKNS